MKKLHLMTVGCVVLLSGCAHHMHGKGRESGPLRGLKTDLVDTVSASKERYLVLNQDPIVLTEELLARAPENDAEAKFSGVPITWTISPSSEWRFAPTDGIKFLKPPAFDPKQYAEVQRTFDGFFSINDVRELSDPTRFVGACRSLDKDNLSYRCLVNVTATQKVKFKYQINLVNVKTGAKRSIDPNMMN